MEMIIILIGKQKLPESSFLLKAEQQTNGVNKDEKYNNDSVKNNKQSRKF